MAEVIETVPFTFDDLYENIRLKFEDKGYDTVEGSNTAQLITAMTYLTSMLNANTAMNINETLLPLTTKKDNAIMNARALGYEVAHKQSYKYRLSLRLSAGNHTIPKYTMFTIGTKTYYYLGKQLDLENVTEGLTIELDVTEGTLYKYTDYPESLSVTTTTVVSSTGETVPQYYIDIPFSDIEENGIDVFITYYDEYGNLYTKEQWYQSKVFMIDKDTTLNKEFIRVDNIEYKTPRIYFTLSGVGIGVREGSVVDINVLSSSGVDGYIDDLTDLSAVSNPVPGSSVTKIVTVIQGTDEEDVESIKYNAPLFHNSANRAVTKSDYEAICNRHPAIKNTMVWGGDDEFPKCPGHIWFSFIPETNIRTYTNDEFKYNFTLDYNGDYSWDYSLDPFSSDEQELLDYAAQKEIADDFFTNWFVEDEEIKSFEYTIDGQKINPGVWDYLDNYKIPTLQFHNRHPIYLDYEYDIQLLKYNIKTSKSDIFQEVFDVIDDYFKNDTTLHLEKFESEYFNSSILKRIDENITDISGFDAEVTTRMQITKKNISMENGFSSTQFYPQYRDLYIQMQIPFEKYFDNDGYLLYDKLPNIDTEDFIEYTGETGQRIYTDWSDIQDDIDNDIIQKYSSVIVAPIRVHQEESKTITTNNQTTIIFNNLEFRPDFPEQTLGNYTYNKVSVYYNGTKLTYNAASNGFLINYNHPNEIFLVNVTTVVGGIVLAKTERHAGKYQLFNTYRKFVLIQLYVDAAGYDEDGTTQLDYDSPKSYLTTLEGFYDFTTDNYYLTTEGYALVNESQANAITGPVVREITTELYSQSPIKMDLFRKVRYLNFKYPSNNFMLIKNIIPRLKRVTFLQGV